MPSHYPEILHREIVALSRSEDWSSAKLEWNVRKLFHNEDGAQCLCTYRPINNLCEIFNPLTRKSTIVGSTCVKKFLDKDYHLEFASLQRLKKNSYLAMNCALLQYVNKQHWLNDKECKFYHETCGKRRKNLSPDQLQWRRSINEKVIGLMNRTHCNSPVVADPSLQRPTPPLCAFHHSEMNSPFSANVQGLA